MLLVGEELGCSVVQRFDELLRGCFMPHKAAGTRVGGGFLLNLGGFSINTVSCVFLLYPGVFLKILYS